MNYKSLKAMDRFLLSIAGDIERNIHLGSNTFDIKEWSFINDDNLRLLDQITITDKLWLTKIMAEFWDLVETNIYKAIDYLFREQRIIQAMWMSIKIFKDEPIEQAIKQNNSEYQLTLETYWIKEC